MMLDKFGAIHMYVYIVLALFLVCILSRVAIWLRDMHLDRRWLLIGMCVPLLLCALLVGTHGHAQAGSAGSNPCLLPATHWPRDPTPPPKCLPWSTATQ